MRAFTAEERNAQKVRLMAAIFIVTTSLKWYVVLQVSPSGITNSILSLLNSGLKSNVGIKLC